MKTPLFFVHCTTCGARIRFYDESRIGQIIPCPKCGSMVMVEWQNKEEKVPEVVPDSAAEPSTLETETKAETGMEKENFTSVPAPPPLPPLSPFQPPLSPESRNEEEPDSEEEVFHFEGEIDSKITSRQILFVTVGIALGIFLCAGVLLFALNSSRMKTSTHALHRPIASEEYPEKEIVEEPVPESGSEESDSEESNPAESVPAEIKAEAAMEAEAEIGETDVELSSEDAPQESAPTEGEELSGLMQSPLGKRLSSSLPTNGSEDSAALPEAVSSEEAPNPDPSGEKSDSGSSSSPEPNSEEAPVTSGNADSPTASADPDALQFTRKKRKRAYSGDPVLDFDEATQEAIPKASPQQVGETGKSSGNGVETGNESPESPVNVPNPTDEKVEENPTPPTLQAFRVKPPTVEFLPEETAARLAIPLESISIPGRPVTDLLQTATQMSGERITTDWKKIATLGVPMESPVTLNLENTTLREALDTGLYSVNLGLISVGLTLRTVGWEAAEVSRWAKEHGEKPEKCVLNLEDLVTTFNAETSGKSGLTEMERLIPMFVHPALWEEANGLGKLTPNPGKARITISQQFPSVIQEVELFFDKIRRARNMETKTFPTNPSQRRLKLQDGTEIRDGEPFHRYGISEETRAIPIDCDLSDGTTLRAAIQEVMRYANSKIIIDEEAIARIPITSVLQDADVPDFDGNKLKLPDSILDIPCVYRFEGISMEEAISTMLKNVPLLCYPIGKNEFFLTTHDEAQRKMLVDFFPIGDLVKNPGVAGTLINGICDTIQPKSWQRGGGAGAIYYDVPSGVLIVRQNPYILYQIEIFLKALRNHQSSDSQEKPQK